MQGLDIGGVKSSPRDRNTASPSVCSASRHHEDVSSLPTSQGCVTVCHRSQGCVTSCDKSDIDSTKGSIANIPHQRTVLDPCELGYAERQNSKLALSNTRKNQVSDRELIGDNCPVPWLRAKTNKRQVDDGSQYAGETCSKTKVKPDSVNAITSVGMSDSMSFNRFRALQCQVDKEYPSLKNHGDLHANTGLGCQTGGQENPSKCWPTSHMCGISLQDSGFVSGRGIPSIGQDCSVPGGKNEADCVQPLATSIPAHHAKQNGVYISTDIPVVSASGHPHSRSSLDIYTKLNPKITDIPASAPAPPDSQSCKQNVVNPEITDIPLQTASPDSQLCKQNVVNPEITAISCASPFSGTWSAPSALPTLTRDSITVPNGVLRNSASLRAHQSGTHLAVIKPNLGTDCLGASSFGSVPLENEIGVGKNGKTSLHLVNLPTEHGSEFDPALFNDTECTSLKGRGSILEKLPATSHDKHVSREALSSDDEEFVPLFERIKSSINTSNSTQIKPGKLSLGESAIIQPDGFSHTECPLSSGQQVLTPNLIRPNQDGVISKGNTECMASSDSNKHNSLASISGNTSKKCNCIGGMPTSKRIPFYVQRKTEHGKKLSTQSKQVHSTSKTDANTPTCLPTSKALRESGNLTLLSVERSSSSGGKGKPLQNLSLIGSSADAPIVLD